MNIKIMSGQLHVLVSLPPEQELITHLIRGCLSLRAGLEVLRTKTMYCSCRDWNLGSPSPLPIHYVDIITISQTSAEAL
jgi:hypothetical protein